MSFIRDAHYMPALRLCRIGRPRDVTQRRAAHRAYRIMPADGKQVPFAHAAIHSSLCVVDDLEIEIGKAVLNACNHERNKTSAVSVQDACGGGSGRSSLEIIGHVATVYGGTPISIDGLRSPIDTVHEKSNHVFKLSLMLDIVERARVLMQPDSYAHGQAFREPEHILIGFVVADKEEPGLPKVDHESLCG